MSLTSRILMVFTRCAVPLTQTLEFYTQAMNRSGHSLLQSNAMSSSQARRNVIACQSGEHCHDYAQVLFGWRGRMDCEFDHSAGRLSMGKAALVPASASHLYTGLTEDSELLVLDIAWGDPLVQALEQACNVSFADTLFSCADFMCLDAQTLALIEFATAQLKRTEGQARALVTCQLVTLLLTQLSQLCTSEVKPTLLNARLDLTELDRLINERLDQPPTNRELAARVNLSESHFNYVFHKQYGMTPQQYVMNVRLRRAQFLLLNSAMSLTAVAVEVGFADASSFSRAYKCRFNETPGSLRRVLTKGSR
ncbi:AraC family transcriptional regulator [Pseudomonas duriflava]|uniref:AraC family transcriptional regulator n=1 Tax=Pseudomonas duriflava TaxID=459528 RepID=A0A562QL72_9PSED|nr:AraC family transcriptional regulator [Pseudomonas duriflava]TWI57423.1 AraC family transcriptional regulator [Pseudomonas duriflava]